MTTIDSILDDIMRLDFESKEVLLEILKKHQSEARRDKIANNARKALKDYKAGKLKSQTAEEVIEELNRL
ncbi:hypothetical protein [Mucilaginibacter sp. OK098]|uniref:hypothetical protein n=1 Tax=Mucilaginibacter sp. OK098 TaxID=1855297 RepID=UPI00091C6C2D|nr:hypothetical protein [Mucilaginibacter sp. OK098]SHM22412.1 hypothetical protein SAMN05216524_1011204 [Mucilaginibacter sp. OK098]